MPTVTSLAVKSPVDEVKDIWRLVTAAQFVSGSIIFPLLVCLLLLLLKSLHGIEQIRAACHLLQFHDSVQRLTCQRKVP